jgi:hypothetical protein
MTNTIQSVRSFVFEIVCKSEVTDLQYVFNIKNYSQSKQI